MLLLAAVLTASWGVGGGVVVAQTAPAMEVWGGGYEIDNGDSSPWASDGTHFGSVDVDTGSSASTFYIYNTGDATLHLTVGTQVYIDGTDKSDFSVTSSPSTTVAPGNGGYSSWTTFQITFNPSSIGDKSATIRIPSNDFDTNPYTFDVGGRGTKKLTVTGVTASNKTYDGGTSASIDTSGASLSGVVSPYTDVGISTAGATGAFVTKHVGTGKTVNISGITLTGSDAGYYTLQQPTASANITARAITISTVTTSKVYDSSTSSSTTPNASPSLVGGDTFTTLSQSYNNRHVGTDKPLSLSYAINDGNSGNNYSVTQVTTATGTITKRSVTVSAVTDSKDYDCTTDSDEDPSVSLGGDTSGLTPNSYGLLGSDSHNFSQSFDSSAVGSRTLSVSGSITTATLMDKVATTTLTSLELPAARSPRWS